MAGKKIGGTKGAFKSIRNEISKSVEKVRDEIKSDIAGELSNVTIDKILVDANVEVDVDTKVKMKQNLQSLIDSQIPDKIKKEVDAEISFKFGKEDRSFDLSELIKLDKNSLKKKISQLTELAKKSNETATKQLYGAVKLADFQGIEYDKESVKEFVDYVKVEYSDVVKEIDSTLSKVDFSSIVKTSEEAITSLAKNTQKQAKIATDSIKQEFIEVKKNIKEYNKEIAKMKKPAFHVGDLESNPNYKADSLGSNQSLQRIGSGSFWSTDLEDALDQLKHMSESGQKVKLYVTDLGRVMGDMINIESENEYEEYVNFLGRFNEKVVSISKMDNPSIKAKDLDQIYEDGKQFFDAYGITRKKLQSILADAINYYKSTPKDNTSDDLSAFLQQKYFKKKGVTTTSVAGIDNYGVGTVVFQKEDLGKIYSITEQNELDINTIKSIIKQGILEKAKNTNNTVDDISDLIDRLQSSNIFDEKELKDLSSSINEIMKNTPVVSGFENLIKAAKESGTSLEEFMSKVRDGNIELTDSIKELLSALGILSDNEFQFNPINEGTRHKDGFVSNDYTIIAREMEYLAKAEVLTPKLIELEEQGVRVGTIIGTIKDETNGLFYEIQKTQKGKIVNSDNLEFLEATDDEIKKLKQDLEVLNKLGVFVDTGGQNLLYEKGVGFSFIDLAVPKDLNNVPDYLQNSFEGIIGMFEEYLPKVYKNGEVLIDALYADKLKSFADKNSSSDVQKNNQEAEAARDNADAQRDLAKAKEESSQSQSDSSTQEEQQTKRETDAIFKKAESLKELRDIQHQLANINNDIALYENPESYIDSGNGAKSFAAFDKKKTGSGYEDLKILKKELLELNPILNDVADSSEKIRGKDLSIMFGSAFGEETPFIAKASTDIKSLIDMYQELVNVNQKLVSVNSDSHLAETLQKYKEDILELNPLLKGVANHTEELVKPVQWQSKYDSYFKKQQEEAEQSSKITITEFKNIISAIDLTSASFEDLLKLWNDFQQTKFDSNKAREVAAFRQVGDQLKNTFEELGYEFDKTNKTWNKKQFNIEGKSLQELVELYQKLGASGHVTEELDKVKLAILGIVEASEKLNPLQVQNFNQILTGLNVKPEDVIPTIKEMYTAEQAVSALENIRDRNKPREQGSSSAQQTQALKEEEQQAKATAEAERKVNEVREQSSTSTPSATSQVSTSTTTFTSEEIEKQKQLISVLEENIVKIKSLIDDEVTKITELEKEIREGVPAAITEKNNAFEEERNLVSKFTGEEINSIQQLNSIYDNLKGFSELIAPDFDIIIQKLGILSDTLKNISLSDQNLGETAKAIRSLAGAIKELQNLDKTNSVMTEATNKAKTMAQALVNEFGIKGKSSIEELQNVLGHLYSNIGNDAEIGRALNNLDKIIRKYGTVEQEVDETNKTIRDFLKNSTLYISSTDKADWGKDLIKVYGSFGYSNITTNKEKGRDSEQLLRDINALFQDEMLNGEIDDSKGIFDLSKINGTQDALRALIAFLENSKPKVIEFSKAINAIPGVKENLSDKIEKIAESVGTTTKESFDSLFEYMNSMGIYDLKDLPIKKLGNEESGNILEKFIPNLGDVQQVIERFDLLKTAINNVQQAIKDKVSQVDEEKKSVLENIPQEIEEFEKLNQKIQEVILTIASKISMIRQERAEVETAIKAELDVLKQLLQQPDIDIKIHADVSNIINEIENALKNASFNINVNPNIGINNGSGNNIPPLSSPGQAPSGSGRKNTKQGVWDIVRQYRVDSKGHTYISDTFKNGNESIIQGLNGNVLRKNEKTSTAYTDQMKLQKKLYSDQKAMINEVFKIKKQIYNLDKVENAEEVSELRGQLKDLQSAINVTKRELRNNGVNKSEVDSKYNEVYGKQQQSYDNWEKQQKAQARDEKRQAIIDAKVKQQEQELEKQKQIYAEELANRTELLNIQHKLNLAQIEGTKEFKSMTDAERNHLEARKQELDIEYQSIAQQRKNNTNKNLRDANDKEISVLKEKQKLELDIAKEKEKEIQNQRKAAADAADALERQKLVDEYIKEAEESERAVQEAKIQIEKEYDTLITASYDKQKAAIKEINDLRKENLKLQVPEGTEQSDVDAKKLASNNTRILELGKEIRSSIEARNQLNRDSIIQHKELVQLQQQLNSEYKEAESNQSKINATTLNKQATKAYKDLLKEARDYYELSAKVSSDTATEVEKKKLKEIAERWEKATQAKDEYAKHSSGDTKSLKDYNDAKSLFDKAQSQASIEERELLTKDLKKYSNLANSADNKYLGEFATKIKEVYTYLKTISETGFDFANQDQVQQLTRILQLKKEIESKQGLESLKKASEETINKLRLKISDFMNKNSGMGKEFMSQFENLKIKLDGSQSVEEIKSVLNEFIKLENEVTKADKLGKSFFKTIGEHWRSITAQWVAQYLSIQDLIRYARTAYTTIVQLDDALLDLKKTTTMSNSDLEEFYHNSASVAKEMGVTSQEIISQASAWSRLGYSSKEAAETMAELSSQFAKISPGTSVEDATDYLVSTMKAFHIETSAVKEDIMSVINQLGNTMATSNQEIGEMLKRSSAAMAAANNSLAQTAALESAAVQITRNAETTGTAFRTISMRIRGKLLPPYTVMYMLCA